MPVLPQIQYCSLSKFYLIGLQERAVKGQNPIPDATLNQELISASAIIDTFLRPAYNLPLTSWGEDVETICACIARYRIISYRGYDPNDNIDQQYRLQYEDCINLLQRVADGRGSLNVVDSSNQTVAPIPSVLSSPPRGWSRQSSRYR